MANYYKLNIAKYIIVYVNLKFLGGKFTIPGPFVESTVRILAKSESRDDYSY